jgi:hypothetical protein
LALESISGVKRGLFNQTPLNINFSQKRSNYHISLWKKVFFSFLTNFFSIHIKVAQCCEESPKKNKKKRSLIGNMVFGGFPNKIRNKTFYFHSKKKFTLIFFYLVLALESISGVKRWLFGQTPLNINFSQKLSNYHISLWRKVFFSYLTNVFFFISKLPNVARSHQKKQKKRSLIKNMVFGGFPKKIRNKTFYFHSINFFSL